MRMVWQRGNHGLYVPAAPPSGDIILANYAALGSSKSGSNGIPQVLESGLATQASGYNWTDGVSSLSCKKITSTTVPSSGNHFTSYPTGGPHCSQAWFSGGKRYYTFVVMTFGGNSYFCDFNWTDWVIEEFYLMPDGGGETDHAFSLTPGQERLCFLITGNKQVRVWDTESRAYADFGIFPWNVSASGNALAWLQTQINDTWIVGMLNDNHTIVAKPKSGGSEINHANGLNGWSIDEPHLDIEDGVIYLSINSADEDNNPPWLLNTDTKPLAASHSSLATDGTRCGDDHATPVRGGMFGGCSDPGSPATYGGAYAWNRVAGQPVRHWVGYAQGIAIDEDFYTNGYMNAFGYQGDFDEQWALCARFTNDLVTNAVRNTVIAAFPMVGTGAKFLVGHQSNTDNGDYEQKVRPGSSPDGLFVYWTTWMMTRGTGSPQFQICAVKPPFVTV